MLYLISFAYCFYYPILSHVPTAAKAVTRSVVRAVKKEGPSILAESLVRAAVPESVTRNIDDGVELPQDSDEQAGSEKKETAFVPNGTNYTCQPLMEGTVIEITIFVMEKTVIRLHGESNQEIPLEISIDASEKLIIFNSKLSGVWDFEMKRRFPSPLPGLFDMDIEVTELGYEIIINDWIAAWNHRMPYAGINTISVEGMVYVHKVEQFSNDFDDDKLEEY
uniref:Galectin n=1 Tax=Caenorhabditis tropicalis TaxID=1561998 RepID=A0A1I7TRB2_9PELO